MQLPKYSIGVGDRFGHQGPAQLDALIAARKAGVSVVPVWNKSHREHSLVGSRPADVRNEADQAVRLRGWTDPYFVDADHIGPATVGGFVEACDFFTLDVADFIGRPAPQDQVAGFVRRHRSLVGRLELPGVDAIEVTEEAMAAAARKFLWAVEEAGRIYAHVARCKGPEAFVTEVSMDETSQPQTPVELLLILAAAAEQRIPLQTIAPRFTGRFNKGVDYVGDVGEFTRQFEQDLAVIAFAIGRFGLPENLKLSIHSGSDKFSLYGPIGAALRKFDAGVHLKTAGTTWLEEAIGLATAGGEGLRIVQEIYAAALGRFDELAAPYASVIDIDRAALPAPETVDNWNAKQMASALRHDQTCREYDPGFRQLMHVSYKLAAEMGPRFLRALEAHADVIGPGVTSNLYQRHIRPLFLG